MGEGWYVRQYSKKASLEKHVFDHVLTQNYERYWKKSEIDHTLFGENLAETIKKIQGCREITEKLKPKTFGKLNVASELLTSTQQGDIFK